jgi:hypothetical protein
MSIGSWERGAGRWDMKTVVPRPPVIIPKSKLQKPNGMDLNFLIHINILSIWNSK